MDDRGNALTLATTTPVDALVLRLQFLRDWDLMANPYPPMTLDEATNAVQAVEAALIKIDLKQLAVALDRTLQLWRTPTGADVMEFYLEALEEFPPEIVDKALKHVRMTHRYPTMPSPADFRSAAEAAAVPLRGILVRARLAEKRLRDLAARQDRWTDRAPAVIGDGTYKPRRVDAVRSDFKTAIDLGDVAANLDRWAAAAEGDVS